MFNFQKKSFIKKFVTKDHTAYLKVKKQLQLFNLSIFTQTSLSFNLTQ